MKLKMIAVGNCEDKNKQVHNQLFHNNFEVNKYIDDKKIKDEYIIFDVYLGNYSYNQSFKKSDYPLTIIGRQIIKGAISSSVQKLTILEEYIDFKNPRDKILDAICVLEKNVKLLKSYLNIDSPTKKEENNQGSLF